MIQPLPKPRPTGLRPLSVEDGENGYWDARTMGNGYGQSFVIRNGVKTWVSDDQMREIVANGGQVPSNFSGAPEGTDRTMAPKGNLPTVDEAMGSGSAGFGGKLPFGGRFLPAIGNAVSDLGYGLATEGLDDMFGAAAKRGAQMQPERQRRRDELRKEAEKLRLAQANAQYLVGDDPQIAAIREMVASGQVDFNTGLAMWKDLKAGNKRNLQVVNNQIVDMDTMDVLGDFRDPEKPDAAHIPSGYRPTADGQGLEFIPGGPADPASQAANKGDTEQTRRARQLATVVNPQIAIVEQNWESLKDAGDQLKGATGQAGLAVPFGVGAPSSGYQQAANALQTIAQSYLYSVSGAAAPAEEVRKLVDSVTPRYGEDEASIDNKLALVKQMVAAINGMANGGAPQQSGQQGGPQVGAVEDGYRYMGGDPADPNSWEPIQ